MLIDHQIRDLGNENDDGHDWQQHAKIIMMSWGLSCGTNTRALFVLL